MLGICSLNAEDQALINICKSNKVVYSYGFFFLLSDYYPFEGEQGGSSHILYYIKLYTLFHELLRQDPLTLKALKLCV